MKQHLQIFWHFNGLLNNPMFHICETECEWDQRMSLHRDLYAIDNNIADHT